MTAPNFEFELTIRAWHFDGHLYDVASSAKGAFESYWSLEMQFLQAVLLLFVFQSALTEILRMETLKNGA
jgi:hypothetical protein